MTATADSRGETQPERRGTNVVLIGYRGSGKSTVGRALAERLGRPFVDSDALIEHDAGSIAALFATRGEAAFRILECQVIARIVSRESQVIAVGGGAVLDSENRVRLRAAGTVVWLTAPAEQLAQRTDADPLSAATRPPLTVAGGLDEIHTLLVQREPLYAAVADHVVPTEGRSISAVVETIVALLPASRPPASAC